MKAVMLLFIVGSTKSLPLMQSSRPFYEWRFNQIFHLKV